MFRADPPAIGYADADARGSHARPARQAASSCPAVEHAAIANIVAARRVGGSSRSPHDRSPTERFVTDRPVPGMRVGPGFFPTLGARMIAGRDFDERDTRAPATRPAIARSIVNESFARRYFGGRSPIGHRVGLGDRPDTPTTIEIVGVVEDFSRRMPARDRGPRARVLSVLRDRQSRRRHVLSCGVRGEPASAFASIRAAVAEVDASAAASSV